MNIEKAKEIATITNQISRCESFLESLRGHSYEDEYVIYYRGMETCDLEPTVLRMIVVYYEDRLKSLQEKLSKM